MEGSQYNILTTVDTITLQSNMIYTIQMSFRNLDGECNNNTYRNPWVQMYFNSLCIN